MISTWSFAKSFSFTPPGSFPLPTEGWDTVVTHGNRESGRIDVLSHPSGLLKVELYATTPTDGRKWTLLADFYLSDADRAAFFATLYLSMISQLGAVLAGAALNRPPPAMPARG